MGSKVTDVKMPPNTGVQPTGFALPERQGMIHVVQPWEHLAVEEQEGAEGLVLCRSSHVFVNRDPCRYAEIVRSSQQSCAAANRGRNEESLYRGASGKLGQYMVQHALDRGYEVVGVCRERSVGKLDAFRGRITVIPGATNDPQVIKKAVAGCDGVLTVLVPWGVHQYASGTAQVVLDRARPAARLIFSCGWHITRDGKDVYPQSFKAEEKLARIAAAAKAKR